MTLEDSRVVVAGEAADSDGKTASGRRTVALDQLTAEKVVGLIFGDAWQGPRDPDA